MLRSLTVGILLAATIACSSLAQSGLALMKVEIGARPAGMGGAFVAVTDGPNSSAYNPAATAHTTKFTASFGHIAYWNNIRLETAYFASNFTKKSWIHGGIRYAADNDLEHRGVMASSEPDYYFNAHDISLKGGFAYQVSNRLVAGASLGWFAEKIDIFQGSVFNADLGVMYDLNPAIDLGASVTNIGPSFNIKAIGGVVSNDISLPTTYRVGGTYGYDKYLGAVDLVVLDDEAHVHLGAEGWLHERFALRSGYMINYDAKSFTAGASFVHRNFTIDYAFVPYSTSLGTTHLFNLTVSL